MKKFIIIAYFLFGINLLFSQNINENKDQVSLDPSVVPPAAVHTFTYENPGLTATWRSDAKNYRVNFIDPATKLGRIIIYDKDGNVVRRENEVDNLTYPTTIGEYYTKKHPGEVYQVWTSDDKNSGKPLYYSSRNTETVWFDKDGNVIPERKAEKATDKKK